MGSGNPCGYHLGILQVTWELWAFVGISAALAVYVILRLLYVLFFCGGLDSGDYYSDPEK